MIPFDPTKRIAVVVAHPDDETIGAGSQFHNFRDCHFVHLTDGSPRDLSFAKRAGYADGESYAKARRAELQAVLRLSGLDAARLYALGRMDQEATLDLVGLTLELEKILRDVRPDFVLTHPYEGGHPDHDAAAFVTARAIARLHAENANTPPHLEMAYYHQRNGAMFTGDFLPSSPTPVIEHRLTLEEEDRKRALFACYVSQKDVLALFSTSVERYRAAPRYDFTKPPHGGPLNYEILGWGPDRSVFCARAADALQQLGGQQLPTV